MRWLLSLKVYQIKIMTLCQPAQTVLDFNGLLLLHLYIKLFKFPMHLPVWKIRCISVCSDFYAYAEYMHKELTLTYALAEHTNTNNTNTNNLFPPFHYGTLIFIG
jgi:hypothetical protein